MALTPLAVASPKPDPPPPNGVVVLDGIEVDVFWDDGDTFKVPATGLKARLAGYNTLESYGPVHRFGPGEQALFAVAKEATRLAMSKPWVCRVLPGDGGYSRKVVDCPDLRKDLLEAGLAHPFGVDSGAPKDDLEAQAVAIQRRAGMWSAGPQETILTSLHSLDEKEGQEWTYNRVLSVATGLAAPNKHQEVYSPCQWVCHKDSCMLYVPYTQRYGDKQAACLKTTE